MSIKAVRMELGDTNPEFPIMSDEEIRYFLDKSDWSIQRTCMDVAKSMLLKLSMRSDESVDIFSIKGSVSAKQFMQALQFYIKNPDLNQSLQNLQGYAGGISKSDMLINDANLDNNTIVTPTKDIELPTTPFGV